MGTYDNAFGGALHDPMFDQEAGCEVCMKYVDDCTCPECPVCGEHGNPKCFGTHMPKKPKKTVWARVSIEVDAEEGEGDDETLMDIIHDELVEYGFTIDDMGMVNPTDKDKFYPEEDK